MSLADEDTSMVNGFGESKLEDLGLQAPFQEVLNLEAEHVIELHAAFVQDSNADQTTQQCVTLEQPAGIFVLKGQEVTSSLADLGQSVLDPPDLTLVLQAIFTNELQLLVQTGFLKWPSGGGEDLGTVSSDSVVHHLGSLSSPVNSAFDHGYSTPRHRRKQNLDQARLQNRTNDVIVRMHGEMAAQQQSLYILWGIVQYPRHL